MTGWTIWSKNIRTNHRRAVSGLALGAAMGLAALPAMGQAQSAEELYQKADAAYNVGKMEEACEILGKLAQISPGYPNSDQLRKESCTEAESQHQKEEMLYKRGVDFLNQGKYDDAKKAFDMAKGIPLSHPKYREEISRYLQQIESQQTSEQSYRTGIKLFGQGQYKAARPFFAQVAQGNGPHVGDAREYLNRITTELAKKKQLPEGPTADTGEPTLRAGLQAYFAGDFGGAEKKLSDYLDNNGRRKGLAYFFRGASYGTEYYLSGEKDSKKRDSAVGDFRSVHDKEPNFQLPDKQYVAPKILSLYSDALAAGN